MPNKYLNYKVAFIGFPSRYFNRNEDVSLGADPHHNTSHAEMSPQDPKEQRSYEQDGVTLSER